MRAAVRASRLNRYTNSASSAIFGLSSLTATETSRLRCQPFDQPDGLEHLRAFDLRHAGEYRIILERPHGAAC